MPAVPAAILLRRIEDCQDCLSNTRVSRPAQTASSGVRRLLSSPAGAREIGPIRKRVSGALTLVSGGHSWYSSRLLSLKACQSPDRSSDINMPVPTGILSEGLYSSIKHP